MAERMLKFYQARPQGPGEAPGQGAQRRFPRNSTVNSLRKRRRTRPRVARNAACHSASPTARYRTTSQTGLNSQPRAGCRKPTRFPPPPTRCRRSAAASARRTGSAKAIASSSRAGHGAVTIGSVENYLTDTAWREGLGRADQAARASAPKPSASSALAPRASPPPRACACKRLSSHGL